MSSRLGANPFPSYHSQSPGNISSEFMPPYGHSGQTLMPAQGGYPYRYQQGFPAPGYPVPMRHNQPVPPASHKGIHTPDSLVPSHPEGYYNQHADWASHGRGATVGLVPPHGSGQTLMPAQGGYPHRYQQGHPPALLTNTWVYQPVPPSTLASPSEAERKNYPRSHNGQQSLLVTGSLHSKQTYPSVEVAQDKSTTSTRNFARSKQNGTINRTLQLELDALSQKIQHTQVNPTDLVEQTPEGSPLEEVISTVSAKTREKAQRRFNHEESPVVVASEQADTVQQKTHVSHQPSLELPSHELTPKENLAYASNALDSIRKDLNFGLTKHAKERIQERGGGQLIQDIVNDLRNKNPSTKGNVVILHDLLHGNVSIIRRHPKAQEAVSLSIGKHPRSNEIFNITTVVANDPEMIENRIHTGRGVINEKTGEMGLRYRIAKFGNDGHIVPTFKELKHYLQRTLLSTAKKAL